jgi:hypothetical protein
MSLTKSPADPGPLTTALKNEALFERWIDPVTGVESFVLSRRVAPIQQSFYFINSGFTDDGRYLWFYCAFPPGGDAYYGRQLAVLDLAEQTVRHFPETQFMDASPFVDSRTGEVYWTTGLGVWKRGPRPENKAERVGLFPSEMARQRRPLRLATHLSRSADHKRFAIDAQIGTEWFVGDMTLDGTGEFRLWQKFEICHNHAQFSPTDPDLLLIAQDGWIDPATGEEGETHDRLWLLRRGQQAKPLLPDSPLPSSLRGHEWWDANGRHVWYIDYHAGTARVDSLTGRRTLVWANGHTHSHGDVKGRYLVGDINPAGDDWRVAFFNLTTRSEIEIVSQLPVLSWPRRAYHVHPHPRFCLDDRYICYTTNVRGTVDVAIVPVDQLIDRTM